MRTLLFKVNVHNTEKVEIPGEEKPRAINLTVRKGLKWSDLKVGDTVNLRDTAADTHDYTNDGTPPGGASMPPLYEDQLATIYDVKVMSFADLMNYGTLLKLEHDPKCQTYHGLHATMRRVYDGFLQHELVTLVMYEPVADNGERRPAELE